jgi:hypothetical protein
LAPEATGQKEEKGMKDRDQSPEPKVPGKRGLKNLKDITKRIVSVPKSEIDEVQADYDNKPNGPRPHPA